MAMTLVSTVTLGSSGTIEFTNIPQTAKDLVLLISARRSDNGNVNWLRFNNDTGSNYFYPRLEGNGATATSSGSTVNADTQIEFLAVPSSATASTFGNAALYISNYTGSTAKSLSIDSVTENNATTAYQWITAGRWTGTSAITSIQLPLTLAQHSTASLYLVS